MIATKQIIINKSNIKFKNVNNTTDINTLFEFYDQLNKDVTHMTSNDDICTPMECVRKMIDYVPNEFWNRENIKVLDPCAGNGNFGAYCMTKTSLDNIWFNEINIIRYNNCKKILKPKHLQNKDFFTIKQELK